MKIGCLKIPFIHSISDLLSPLQIVLNHIIRHILNLKLNTRGNIQLNLFES